MPNIREMQINSFVDCVRETLQSGMTIDEAVDHARSMATEHNMDTYTLVEAEKRARKMAEQEGN